MAGKKCAPKKRDNSKRDYKKEYARDGKHKSSYRAALNRRARMMGHYGNTPPGKDLVHKGGKIVGLGDRRKNRQDGARHATMSRMKARRKKKKK